MKLSVTVRLRGRRKRKKRRKMMKKKRKERAWNCNLQADTDSYWRPTCKHWKH